MSIDGRRVERVGSRAGEYLETDGEDSRGAATMSVSRDRARREEGSKRDILPIH